MTHALVNCRTPTLAFDMSQENSKKVPGIFQGNFRENYKKIPGK